MSHSFRQFSNPPWPHCRSCLQTRSRRRNQLYLKTRKRLNPKNQQWRLVLQRSGPRSSVHEDKTGAGNTCIVAFETVHNNIKTLNICYVIYKFAIRFDLKKKETLQTRCTFKGRTQKITSWNCLTNFLGLKADKITFWEWKLPNSRTSAFFCTGVLSDCSVRAEQVQSQIKMRSKTSEWWMRKIRII